MRILLRNAALLLLFTFLLPALAQAENQGLVWAVKGKNCTVWLAGTIHFANQDLYPLPTSMERAFEQAEVLAVEADVTKVTEEDVQVLSQLAAYPPGQTLSRNVSARTLKAFKDAGMDLTPFDALRPWYAVMTGVTVKLAEMGFSPDMGLDMHLLQRAHATGKPVVELESIQGQFKLMAGLAKKDERSFMAFMLKGVSEMQEQVDIIMNAWKKGDAEGMARELFSDLGSEPMMRPLYQAIYFNRNKGMAAKVTGFLKSGKDHLVLVGAGHLVGPKSVIKLLEKRGYKPVQQLGQQ